MMDFGLIPALKILSKVQTEPLQLNIVQLIFLGDDSQVEIR